MLIDLRAQHAMRMRRIVFCGLSGYTVFFHIISQKVGFSKEKKVIEYKMCFDFLYNFHKKNLVRWDTNFYWSSCKVPIILVR